MDKKLFDEILSKDVISWNYMLSGYVIAGDMDTTSSLFWHMPKRNLDS